MNLRSYLDKEGVIYEWLSHNRVYSAQQLAEKEHIPGDQVVKPVVVQADGQFVLCCLPASYRIDWSELRTELNAHTMRMANEMELPAIFQNCEIGAEPPIGSLFGIPTVIDASLLVDEQVTFQAGTHTDAVRMSFSDFFRLTQPKIGNFAKHA